ncbi:MAG: DNA primase [Candidatus Melainabacteria bacterium]|nr:DNA primase [Candidatus Melainabacteria bacterium]
MIKNFQEIIEQLKSQVPIQELISEFIPVKKSGRGFVALCPFHDDHHPSLQIHPQKGIFKCFSCGTGGDLITFYALINKKKWSEVIPELALKYNLKIEYGNENTSETQVKNKLFELNKIVSDFFKKNLFDNLNKEALNYLLGKRKLSIETIEKYEIGFAKNSWDSLLNYLTKEMQYSNELIIASGLFIIKENQQGYYDRFRNRIIFPIYNEANNITGFGGRALSNDDVKYINSPETLIFNKGQGLYGLNFAKDEIKKLDYVILTEGYLDVITAHQNNLLNTVAPLGTALTTWQARLLTKYTDSKKVYLCLDSDIAGKKAVENIFRLTQEITKFVNLDLRVTSNLPGKDLDESLNQEDTNSIRKKIESSGKLTHFIFDRLSKEYFNATNEISKKNIFNEITEIIISIKDLMEQNENIKYISQKLSINEELINLKLKDKLRIKKQKKSPDEDMFKMHTIERFQHAETELLALYISLFPDIEEIKKELSQIEFIDEKHKLIKEFLDSMVQTNIKPHEVINQLIIQFNEYKHLMNVISDLALKIETEEQTSGYFKNKKRILTEAKEWIKWWITNKQKLKSLASQLKECKNKDEETKILSEMISLVKTTNK